MSQTTYENEKTPSDELLINIIYHNRIDAHPFSDEMKLKQQQFVEELKNHMKEFNKKLVNFKLPEFPLLAAIQELCHPILVEELWKLCPDKITYRDISFFNKMPRICNPETRELYLIPAIKDTMKWIYIIIKYSMHNKINNKIDKINALIFLDKYAEIFGIDYEKINYD